MNRRPHLYYHQVSAAQLPQMLDDLKSHLSYLYWESESAIELVEYQTVDAAWSHGRAFGPELEVRWQAAGNGFDLLLLTESDLTLPEGWRSVEADDALPIPDTADPQGYAMLWGTHLSQLQRPHRLAGEDGDAWIETRIPRMLRYPVNGKPKWVRAQVIVYRSAGRPVLTRLAGLEGVYENEQPALW